MNKYLYTFDEAGNVKERIVEYLPENWVRVNGSDYPIEDFGDYILSDEKIESPWEEWLKHLKEE